MTTKEALAQAPPPAAKPLLTALNSYSRHEEGSSAERSEQGTTKPTEHHEKHPKNK